jgi:hypothetical protein
MAQAGFTPIQLYFSTTAAAVPTAGNLSSGELAINITDGKLYYKSNAGVVTLLAGATAGPAGGSNTQVQFNSSGVLAGSSNMTFNGTTLTVNDLTDSSLTAGRVTYAGTSGNLVDSANLTFNGTTLTANTIGAFTLSGTIAGGGNQINNVIIGTTTPLAGAFTTLSASGAASLGGSTAQVIVNRLSDATTYGAVTFNGNQTNAGILGLVAISGGALQLRAPSGSTIVTTIAGTTDITSVSSTGLAVTGTLGATINTGGYGFVSTLRNSGGISVLQIIGTAAGPTTGGGSISATGGGVLSFFAGSTVGSVGTAVADISPGSLAVTGSISTTSAVEFNGSDASMGAGQIKYITGAGLSIQAKTGSSYDFTLFGAAGNNIMRIPTGTVTLDFAQAGVTFNTTGVGIGTNNPATPLDVTKAGGSNFVATFQNTTAATPYCVQIKDAATPTAGYPLLTITNSTGATPYFRVDSSNGNVGIGTSPTTAKLAVTATSSTLGVFQQTSATGFGLTIVPGADTIYDALTINNAANSLNQIRMYGNGNATFAGGVGVGTTSVNYPLSFSGNVSTYQAAGTQAGFGASGFGTYGPHIGTTNRTYIHFIGGGGGSTNSTWIHGYQVANPAGGNWIRVAPGISANPVVGHAISSDGVYLYYNDAKTTGDADYTPTLRNGQNLYGFFVGDVVGTSGYGYTFPATQIASTNANTLDDYEEGTFEPNLSDVSGNLPSGYSVRTGFYTKIGNTVTVVINITLTNKASISSAMYINNMPFPTIRNGCQGLGLGNNMSGLVGPPTGGIYGSAMYLYNQGAVNQINLNGGNFTNTTSLELSVSYLIS